MLATRPAQRGTIGPMIIYIPNEITDSDKDKINFPSDH